MMPRLAKAANPGGVKFKDNSVHPHDGKQWFLHKFLCLVE